MSNSQKGPHYWDSAIKKVFTHPFNIERFSEWVPPDREVIDYGCGNGRIVAMLSERGYTNLRGFDTSQNMISVARESFPELRFETVQEFPLPIADESVDAIVLFSVLTCIPDDKAAADIMQELQRILRSGGIIYLSDYAIQSDDRNISRYKKFEEKYQTYGIFETSDGGVFRHRTQKVLSSLHSIFEEILCEELDILTMNGHPAKGYQFMGYKT